jgi:hypothetical protein
MPSIELKEYARTTIYSAEVLERAKKLLEDAEVPDSMKALKEWYVLAVRFNVDLCWLIKDAHALN